MTWKLLCGALFTSALAFACTDPTDSASAAVTDPTADAGGSGAHRPPPKPPQQALDACAKSAEGDACAFDIDSHHVTGTCSHGPDGNGPLACKPDQPPPPKPPQAALDACVNKADGDACTVTCENGDTVDGTCTTPPDGSAIVCAPDA